MHKNVLEHEKTKNTKLKYKKIKELFQILQTLFL